MEFMLVLYYITQVDSSKKNNITSVVAEVADTTMSDKLTTVGTDVKQRYFRRRSTAINMAFKKRSSSLGKQRMSLA